MIIKFSRDAVQDGDSLHRVFTAGLVGGTVEVVTNTGPMPGYYEIVQVDGGRITLHREEDNSTHHMPISSIQEVTYL